jgi:acyl carrier protein
VTNPARFERFAVALGGAFEVDKDIALTTDTSLIDDLGFDSFDYLRLALFIEDAADVYFADVDGIELPRTLGDAYTYYTALCELEQ